MPNPNVDISQKASSPQGGGGDKALLGFLAILAFIYAVVPLTLGGGLYLALRNRLSRLQFGFIFAAGAVGSVVAWIVEPAAYFSFPFRLIGDGSWGDFPFFEAVFYSAVTASVLGGLSSKVLARITPAPIQKKLHLVDDEGSELILPSESQRRAAQALPFPDTPGATRSARRQPKRTDDEVGVVPLGIDPATGKEVVMYAPDFTTHGQVLGSTGSGKTESLKRIVAGLLDLGWDGCVLDLKEDIGEGGLGPFLEAYARSHGRPYQAWAVSFPRHRYYFNLFEGLAPDQAANAIISIQDFEAPHYAAMSKRQIKQLITLMYDAHRVAPEKFPAPNLRDLGRYLTGDLGDNVKEMRAVVRTTLVASGQRSDEDYSMLIKPSQKEIEVANGLANRVAEVFESEVGRVGMTPGPGRQPLDVTAPGITYIGLDEMGQKDTTRILAATVLSRFGGVASEMKHAKVRRQRFLMIDEAASADQEILINLLRRARSAGLAIIVATQSAKDWGENWSEITQNTTWTLAMKQQDIESAMAVSALIGTRTTTAPSRSVRLDASGRELGESLSFRETEELLVPPEVLRELTPGEGVLRVANRYESMTSYKSFVKVARRPQDKLPSHVQIDTTPFLEDHGSRHRISGILDGGDAEWTPTDW